MTRARESPGDFANRCCQFRLQPLCEVTSWARTWCHMDERGASTELWRHVGPSPRTGASQPTARPWTTALHVFRCERSVQEKCIQFATLQFRRARHDCTYIHRQLSYMPRCSCAQSAQTDTDHLPTGLFCSKCQRKHISSALAWKQRPTPM